MYSKRINSFDVSGIRRMFDLSIKLKNPCNLSIGQSHFKVREEVKEAIKGAIDKDLTDYTQTQGILPLREAILKKYADKGVPQESAFVTSGVTGAIMLAYVALLDIGEEIILPDPYFVVYPTMASVFGVKPIFVDTYPTFHWNEEKLRKVITPKTRAIVVNSPSNPTGVSATEDELKMIANVAKDHDLTIIYDEIYEIFNYDGPHFDMSRYYAKTITLHGFSKNYSFTGLRLASVVGPKDILDAMLKLQQYTFVCAPSIIQWAGLHALEHSCDYRRDDYRKKRDFMVESLSPFYKFHRPTGAFYMFIETPKGITGENFIQEAFKEELMIINGGIFSQKDTHFRLSYATTDEQLQRGVEILIKLASKFRGN